MIKIVFCLRRKPAMSVEDFQRYWLETHGPLVRRHQQTLQIRRYIQSHSRHGALSTRLREFRDCSAVPYDGVAVVWYDSEAALAALGNDKAARAAARELREDEARFIDLANSPVWIAEEHELIAEVGTG